MRQFDRVRGVLALTALAGLTHAGCSSAGKTTSGPHGGAGNGGSAGTDSAGTDSAGADSAGAANNDAGMTGDAGAVSMPEETGPAHLGLLNAAQGLKSFGWSLTADGGRQSGALPFAQATRLAPLPPGSYTLELTLGSKHVSRSLQLLGGGESTVVVSADAAGNPNWQVNVIEVPPAEPDAKPSHSASARLFLVNEALGGARAFDVGLDDLEHPDGSIEPGAVSEQWPLDVTRPALAFVHNGAATDDFTLPVPEAGSTVIAVLLGDPAADGLGPTGLRLLVARMAGAGTVDEVRPDPVLYFLHSSGVHAGVDLFAGPGNPVASIIQLGQQSASGFARETSLNTKLVRAELADNVRFGELRASRLPPGPATLEAFLTIPGDPQLPVPLNYDSGGMILLPNQRLRNGFAIARQGAQTVGGQLEAGAEYLVILPGNGPWIDNRDPRDAPRLAFERVQQPKAGAQQASIRFADATTTLVGGIAHVELDGATTITGTLHLAGAPYVLDEGVFRTQQAAQPLEVGTHHLSFDILPNIMGVKPLLAPLAFDFDVQAGQNLLVIAAGEAVPPPVVLDPSPRADDIDADTAVASAYDPQTQTFADPNYLPADGNSELVQDDCPTEPGPVTHRGCPVTGLHWLIVDLATKPPTVRVLPMK